MYILLQMVLFFTMEELLKTSDMKISELIKKLQEIQEKKGDVKVTVCDNENEVYELSEEMIENCLGCVCIYGI